MWSCKENLKHFKFWLYFYWKHDKATCPTSPANTTQFVVSLFPAFLPLVTGQKLRPTLMVYCLFFRVV